MGFLNLNNCFPRGKAVPGEAKVGTNDDIKKSLGEIDKKARQWGTGLKRNMRKAVQSFNGAKLSAKVHPVDPHVMAQSTEFARGKVNELNQKMQEKLKDSRGAQSPRAPAGASTGRARLNAHVDRQSKAPNATSSQTSHASRREGKKQFNTLPEDFVAHFNKVKAETEAGTFKPQAKTQPERYRAPNNVTHRQQSSSYEHLQMSEAEARRIVSIGVPHDSPDVKDALDLVARARQVLDEIQEKKDRNKLQKKIDGALNPGGRNARVSPLHVREHQEQKECERILEQQAHYDMSDAELKELWGRQKSAQKRLEELERFAVFDNAGRARTEKMTLLQGALAKVENALNKMEQKHPDFDDRYLHLSTAQLAKQRANLLNEFTKLNLDYSLTSCESTLARWIYEMESGARGPLPEHVDDMVDEVVDACNMAKTLNQSGDEEKIAMRRMQNLAEQLEKIKREI